MIAVTQMGIAPWAEDFGRSSLLDALCAAAVCLLCRLCPPLSAATRCRLWGCVCLKMFVTGVVALIAACTPPSSPDSGMLSSVWLCGVLVGLGVVIFQSADRYLGFRNAQVVDDYDVREYARELSRRFGLRVTPRIVMSDRTGSPSVWGVWQPTILLSRRDVRDLSPSNIRMRLACALAQIRRGDFWQGWVPCAAQVLCFFNPWVWFAGRAYALARDQACELRAQRILDSPADEYARLLLQFGALGTPSDKTGISQTAPLVRSKHRRRRTLRHDWTPPSRSARSLFGVLALLGVFGSIGLHSRTPLPVSPVRSASRLLVTRDAEVPKSPNALHVPPILLTTDGFTETKQAHRTKVPTPKRRPGR